MNARERKRRTVFAFLGLSVFALAAAASAGIIVWISLTLRADDQTLKRVAFHSSPLPCTVTVYGRSQDTLSARVSFYTTDGDLVRILERSWSGWELKIDCIVVGEAGGWLVFPFRIFTDETSSSKGLDLFRYYTVDRFPVLYESHLLNESQRHRLKTLFSIVRTESWMPGFFGSLRHETVSIRNFEAGREYSLFVNGLGRLSLVPN